MNRCRAIALPWASFAPALACAADPPPTLAPAGSLTSLFQVLFGLALVMVAIGVAAWLARRYLPGVRQGGGPVRIVGGVHVGPKEKVVVVEVRDQWLVLGVTSTQVNALHTMPRPSDAGSTPSAAASPDGLVAKWLAGRESR